MFDMIISFESFIFLMIASFLAGFLDSIAGGGGLISLPAYMLSGLPMHMVYACNKFAAACGTTIATLRYYRNKMVDIPIGLTAAAGAFLCSAIAAKIVLYLNENTLKTLLLIFLPVVAVVTLVNKHMGNENHSDRFSKGKKFILAFLIGGFIGFYDGLIGPGTTSRIKLSASGSFSPRIIIYGLWLMRTHLSSPIMRRSTSNVENSFLFSHQKRTVLIPTSESPIIKSNF